jgi:DNA-binding NtrC family response regulator
MSRILVVDDEPEVLAALYELLAPEGHEVTTSTQPELAMDLIAANRTELAILDVWMPGMDGLSLYRYIREIDPYLPVIVMTGKGTTDLAIESSKLGAFHYLPKPFDPEGMLSLVQAALKKGGPAEESPVPQEAPPKDAIIGQSPAMLEVYRTIGRVAGTDTGVLIRGESGTGKELIARAVWAHSARSGRPLVALNCVAIPETLLESELFGHERGAFTGAVARRLGKFQQADRGTILLDEIADVSLAVQAKILRILQERTFERVGGNETLRVDVRIIAATNRNLEAAMRKGRFREDLYHRLHVVTIWVPPLRDRKEDIPALVAHFLNEFARELGTGVPSISKEGMRTLCTHLWPGNVRELKHCVHRLFLLSPRACLGAEDVRQALELRKNGAVRVSAEDDEDLLGAVRRYLSAHTGAGTHELLLDRVGRLAVIEALRREQGNQTRAAESLGIPRPTLHLKMQKYGIRVRHGVEENGVSDH